MSSILIVEDEAPLGESLSIALRRAGYDVTNVGTVERAQAALGQQVFDLAIVDLRLPDGDGLTLLESLRAHSPETGAIVMTAYGSVDVAVEAMRAGVFDFLEKPFGHERLVASVHRALEHTRLKAELRRRAGNAGPTIIGDSKAMEVVRQRVRQSVDARVVLVTGDTGTGKNLVAGAIHAHRDPTSPFVVVHCGTLPAATIDSELFGHVQGAFPGAEARRGLLRDAEGGAVFFDEIATVPLELQPKLLRFFEDGELRPVGSDRTVTVDCQVIVATSRDLAAEAKAGRMRQDLLYRLDVFRIALPPLRRRIDDVPQLTAHLVSRVAARLDRPPPRLEPAAADTLRSHDWPGNVRELEHCLERAILLSDDGVLTADLLEPFAEDPQTPPEGEAPMGPLRPLADVDKEHILRVLHAMDGDRTRAARTLGISRSTLRRKLITYGEWAPAGSETDSD